MTTTATGSRSTGTNQPARGRLPAVRRDRRPALAALALLLVLVGALGSALVAYRSGDRVDVLVARDDIAVGQEFDRNDFSVARVSADQSNVVDADATEAFDGTHATDGIPAGTLLNGNMYETGDVVPDGAQLVGLVVVQAQRTTDAPAPGDKVGLYYVSQGAGDAVGDYSPGDPVVESALVMQASSTGSSDGLSLTVLVKDNVAGTVAELAASSSLAVSVLPASATADVESE